MNINEIIKALQCKVHTEFDESANHERCKGCVASELYTMEFNEEFACDTDKLLKLTVECIKQLQAENEELKKQNQWISVKDRLPEYAGHNVIVRAKNIPYGHSEIFLAFLGYGDYKWHTTDKLKQRIYDGRILEDWNVTHWQPLPQPPKESEDNKDGEIF
jgi:hypothetical protein